MISRETITEAAVAHQTSDLNIAREYTQHLFLNYLYKKPEADGLLFKGGTALRIVYKSPRFSEDLDFSSYGMTRDQVEPLFLGALADIERQGVNIVLNEKSRPTTGGYYGEAHLRLYEHDLMLEINVNMRGGTVRGEYRLIRGEFAPNYSLLMLPEAMLVKEKLDALKSRRKPRDFYDLYFMLRSGLISAEMRGELRDVLPIVEQADVDFRQELGVFLPHDNQSLIRDFKSVILAEIRRNIGGLQ